MSIAKPIRNTSVDYACVQCGGPGNIIRQTPDPRVKCMNCGHTYDGSQSTAAKEAGAIPDEPPKLQDPDPAPLIPEEDPRPTKNHSVKKDQSIVIPLPRTLRYLIVAKDRYGYDFCNDKNFNKTVMQWEAAGKKYEVYELQTKKVEAKVSIE